MLLAFIVGYLLGSLNFSIFFTRIFAKTDVREHGSGNAGFTNTLRAAGKTAAILTFACDALKAVVAIVVAGFIGKIWPDYELWSYARYAAAFGVVLGHNFPVYHNFKGGKGIVSSFAAILSVNWISALFVLGAFLVAFLLTGYVSLGSIMGAVMVMVCTLVMYIIGVPGVDLGQVILMLMLGVLAIYMHRANIKRLIDGTESNFKKKKK